MKAMAKLKFSSKWYSFEYNYVKMAFNLNGMVSWISLKLQTLYGEIRTTCSVNTLSVGRQWQKCPSDKYFWMGKLLWKNMDEIIERPLKKNTSKNNKNTYRNKRESLNTTNLVSSIFLYRRKISLLFFSAPVKICWKHVVFETMRCHWELISARIFFPNFGNLTVIKYKTLCERK